MTWETRATLFAVVPESRRSQQILRVKCLSLAKMNGHTRVSPTTSAFTCNGGLGLCRCNGRCVAPFACNTSKADASMYMLKPQERRS